MGVSEKNHICFENHYFFKKINNQWKRDSQEVVQISLLLLLGFDLLNLLKIVIDLNTDIILLKRGSITKKVVYDCCIIGECSVFK